MGRHFSEAMITLSMEAPEKYLALTFNQNYPCLLEI